MPLVLRKIYTVLRSEKQNDIDELSTPDLRYGGLEKYWSFYKEEELVNLLKSSGFKVIDVAISHKNTNYQTHPLIKIFAEKQ